MLKAHRFDIAQSAIQDPTSSVDPDCPLFNTPLVRQSCAACYRQKRPQPPMPLPDSLHNAVRSLTGALDLLEAAVERRAQAEASRADREQEVSLMQEDRVRLGEDLERAEQLNACLRAAGATTLARLGRMDAICAALRQRAVD